MDDERLADIEKLARAEGEDADGYLLKRGFRRIGTHHTTLLHLLREAGYEKGDFRDTLSGLPRRHFIEVGRVVFRFTPEDRLEEIYVLRADQAR